MPTRVPRKEPNWKKRGDGSERLYANRMRYYRALWRATPTWLTSGQRRAMACLYRVARRRSKGGEPVVVDHVVPLKSRYVCGLNVPWNLRIVPKGANAAKSNAYWPGCPWENAELFNDYEPQQLKLL
jgi:hypothetical protein